MNLIEFLLARIAEDEEVARGAVRWSEGASQWADDGEPDWQHIARWDPARVLAECEAKRRIVGWYASLSERVEAVPALEPRQNELGMVLRALALPYVDHPDYDEAWRP